MADDIVTRLRSENRMVLAPLHMSDAADEIERLRAREQDLRMHAEQDACEIERLRAAGDALANAAMHACQGSDLSVWTPKSWSRANKGLFRTLTAWTEARRG